MFNWSVQMVSILVRRCLFSLLISRSNLCSPSSTTMNHHHSTSSVTHLMMRQTHHQRGYRSTCHPLRSIQLRPTKQGLSVSPTLTIVIHDLTGRNIDAYTFSGSSQLIVDEPYKAEFQKYGKVPLSRMGINNQQDIEFQKQTATDIAERVDFPQYHDAMIAGGIALFICPVPGYKADSGPVVELYRFYTHLEDALHWAYFVDQLSVNSDAIRRSSIPWLSVAISIAVGVPPYLHLLNYPAQTRYSRTQTIYSRTTSSRTTRRRSHTTVPSATSPSTLASWPSRTSSLQETWHSKTPLESSCRRTNSVSSIKDFSGSAPASGSLSQSSFRCSPPLVFSRRFVGSRRTHKRAMGCLFGGRVTTSVQTSCALIAILISQPLDVWPTN
jgi:hypothetical protein